MLTPTQCSSAHAMFGQEEQSMVVHNWLWQPQMEGPWVQLLRGAFLGLGSSCFDLNRVFLVLGAASAGWGCLCHSRRFDPRNGRWRLEYYSPWLHSRKSLDMKVSDRSDHPISSPGRECHDYDAWKSCAWRLVVHRLKTENWVSENVFWFGTCHHHFGYHLP